MSGTTGADGAAGFQQPLQHDEEQDGLLRRAVRATLRELVRKKPGGGGYVLYSPNRGKKRPPKLVGEFPTKAAARKAELARFPPKDSEKLKRLRKDIERLMKDPAKRIQRDKETAATPRKPDRSGAPKAQQAKGKRPATKTEALAQAFAPIIMEALFEREEQQQPSRWDERLAGLSREALAADKKLGNLQKVIEKAQAETIGECGRLVAKSLRGIGKVDLGPVKSDGPGGKAYAQMTIDVKGVKTGPFYVYVEGGRPKLEMSGEAKASLSRVDPKDAKALRAELVSCAESLFPRLEDVARAVERRDSYLDKLESRVDDFLSDLTAAELTLAKNLMAKKYRGGRKGQ